MAERHRVRGPLTLEEKRRLLARQRYAKRYRRIDQNRRRGPQFLMVLLSVLAMALILYKMFGPELLLEGEEAITDTFTIGSGETAAADVRVDPEPYRAEVEAFERALFGDTAARSLNELGTAISIDGLALIERLGTEEKPRLGQLATSLEMISAQLTRAELDLEKMSELRQTWLEARDRAFRRAPWFGGEAVAASEDAGLHTVYLQAASALLDLVDSARAEAESLSEAAAEGERVQSAWQDFERGFIDQLRDIEWSLPEERPGVKAVPRLLAAIQKLESAIEVAREQVVGGEPSFPQRQEPYEEAMEAARDAIDAFEDLGDPL